MSEHCTVVLGGRHYRVERDWGERPAGFAWGFVSQVAVDGRGRVHVFQRGGPPVVVFEASGELAFSYGEGRIADAHGIYAGPSGRIFLVDRDAHEVVIADADGHELASLGERHRPREGAPFNHPTDAAESADGEIYVADGYGNAAVHRFAADGSHLASWGRLGRERGEFMTPHAVWVYGRDRVLVADRENDRVQVFDRDGRFIQTWGGFVRPMDIWVDAEGFIYVTDQIPSLHLLDPHGERISRCRPSLNGAHGIFGAPDGMLYLAEMNPGCVTRLVPMGEGAGA